MEIDVVEQDRAGDVRVLRVRDLPGGGATTVHVASHPLASTRVRIVELEPPRALQAWCAEGQVPHALNGGFFTKPHFHPLGELRVDGVRLRGRDFREPWDVLRGAIAVAPDGEVRIGRRSDFDDEFTGSLLQAAPLLVSGGRAVVDHDDPEGLSSTSDEFDSDIAAEPLPRAAVAITADAMLAVAVDGRSDEDRGLLLHELAELLVQLGAREALNLDGGSSASLVAGGSRRNVPRDDAGDELVDGYPTPCAIVFERE